MVPFESRKKGVAFNSASCCNFRKDSGKLFPTITRGFLSWLFVTSMHLKHQHLIRKWTRFMLQLPLPPTKVTLFLSRLLGLRGGTVSLIGVRVSMHLPSPVESIELQTATKSLFTATAQNNKARLWDEGHSSNRLLLKETVRWMNAWQRACCFPANGWCVKKY